MPSISSAICLWSGSELCSVLPPHHQGASVKRHHLCCQLPPHPLPSEPDRAAMIAGALGACHMSEEWHTAMDGESVSAQSASGASWLAVSWFELCSMYKTAQFILQQLCPVPLGPAWPPPAQCTADQSRWYQGHGAVKSSPPAEGAATKDGADNNSKVSECRTMQRRNSRRRAEG